MFRHLHREPGFYKRLFLLALPLILQNLITTSLGFVDTFMVGMLGQNELSAVTAANTPIYLLQIIILGLLSGLSVLASQYWGKGDTDSINRCMGVSLYAGLIIAVSVAAVLFFFPLHVMALVTNNDLLIELGAPYLRIVGLSYIFNTISSVYIGMQRSTENPAMGMIVFGISMLTNTGLNYIYVVPGPDHLWELKQVLYDRPYPNEEKETPYEGFAYQSIVPVEGTITLPCQADIRALFQMTPYYWKTPKTGAKRLADLESLTTRISFRIHIFQKL